MNTLPIDRLVDVKLKQKKNYPFQKSVMKFNVFFHDKEVEAEVWMEDPINYHYFFVDEDSNLIRFGILRKTDSPLFKDLWREYKRKTNYYS